MSEEGIFYSLMERVGGDGRYQNISLVLWCIIYLNIGATSFYNPYIFTTGNFECYQKEFSDKDCNSYVCSLPSEQRYAFKNVNFSSLATDYGYDSCNNSTDLDKIQTFIYLGGILGSFLTSSVGDMISKKKMLLFTLLLSIIGLLLTIFSLSMLVAGIGLFISFSVKSVTAMMVTCFITECSAQTRRGRDVMLSYLFYGVGVTLNGVVFYYFSSWKLALLFYQVLPSTLCLFGVLIYIKQTPYDMIVHSNPQTTYQQLLKIAKINQIQATSLTIDEITLMKLQYEQNQRQKHDYLLSAFDLIRYKSLRYVFILLVLLSLFLSIAFCMPQLVLKNYNLSIYLNGVILGSSQIFASFFCYLFIDDFERKAVLYWTSLIGIACTLPIFLMTYNAELQNSQIFTICQTIGIFIYRLSTSVSYNFSCMLQSEIYPTQIRSIALQVSCFAINLVFLGTPFVLTAFERANTSIIILFSVTCFLIMTFTYPLPETKGIPPPQMIEELKYLHQQELLKRQSNKQPQQIDQQA